MDSSMDIDTDDEFVDEPLDDYFSSNVHDTSEMIKDAKSQFMHDTGISATEVEFSTAFINGKTVVLITFPNDMCIAFNTNEANYRTIYYGDSEYEEWKDDDKLAEKLISDYATYRFAQKERDALIDENARLQELVEQLLTQNVLLKEQNARRAARRRENRTRNAVLANLNHNAFYDAYGRSYHQPAYNYDDYGTTVYPAVGVQGPAYYRQNVARNVDNYRNVTQKKRFAVDDNDFEQFKNEEENKAIDQLLGNDANF